MIKREIAPYLVALFEQYPFVTVTGPRQSGKTTRRSQRRSRISTMSIWKRPISGQFADSDPRGFLAPFREGAILDEIQRVPDLLSYLQVLGTRRGGTACSF